MRHVVFSLKSAELDVLGGTHIDFAKAEAIQAALHLGCPVSFKFNDEKYTVQSSDIHKCFTVTKDVDSVA